MNSVVAFGRGRGRYDSALSNTTSPRHPAAGEHIRQRAVARSLRSNGITQTSADSADSRSAGADTQEERNQTQQHSEASHRRTYRSPVFDPLMNFTSRTSCLFRILTLLTVVSLQTAIAQNKTPQAHSTIPAPPESDASGTELDSGFWYLSTEHSPQNFRHTCPQFCPSVCRWQCGYQQTKFSSLLEKIEPGVPVCIMVHGSFVRPELASSHAPSVWHWFRSAARGRKMQFIYFRWPSYRPITPGVGIDANLLGLRAARNGYYLAELVHRLPADCPVCLVGHSHGTRVISSALHQLSGGCVQGIRHPYARHTGRRIRAVYTGAAIDHDWLNPGERYDRTLNSVECLLTLRNRLDPVLKIYPLRLPIIAQRPLGVTGFTEADREALGRRTGRIVECDVTDTVGVAHTYPNYFSKPQLAMLMHNYLYMVE